MKLVRQSKLFFKEGNSDKVYEVDLCEIGGNYVVNFRYGRAGTALKEGTKTTSPVALAEAEKVFNKLVSEKTNKGYQVSGEEAVVELKPVVTVAKDIDQDARNKFILNLLQQYTNKSEPIEKGFVGKIISTIQNAVSGKSNNNSKEKVWKIERAVWRAGELKIKEAAPLLLELYGSDNFLLNYCCIWALGFCGDEKVLPNLIQIAETGNDSKSEHESLRRIAREAIFKLGDETTKNLFREKAVNRLPEDLRKAWDTQSKEILTDKLNEILQKPRKNAFDELTALYEINDEVSRSALIEILPTVPLKAKYFRPLRHIFKMAEYRRDGQIFGIIAKRFEVEKGTYNYYYNAEWKQIDGKWKSVEKGDGLKTATSDFAYGNSTKAYLQRRTWRTLRRLGELGDADFVKMAVGSLLVYTDADATEPRTSTFYNYYDENGNYNWRNPRKTTVSWDKFAPYLLLSQLLYRNSPRYELKEGTRSFRCRKSYKIGTPAPDFREEAFPKLWEAQPVGLLHLIAESRCEEVHNFAAKALRDCKGFCEKMPIDAILMILQSPYEVSATLGFDLAKSRYDAANPNVDLVLAVALCENSEARAEAIRWIDAKRDFFAKQSSVMLKLLTAKHEEVRQFAGNLLLTTSYSEDEKQFLLGRLISEMFSFDESKQAEAKDLGEILLKSFAKDLQKLNLDVVKDLLSHQLVEVQEFGGKVLLNHETPAEKLPNELINSLIASQYAEIRAIGIRLFGQLPEENLLQRESVIAAFLAHELEDVHNATRPILQRLAKNEKFAENMTRRIIVALLQGEISEEIESRLLNSLREDIPNFANYIDEETARILLEAKSVKANELGGLAVQANVKDWSKNFTTAEIVKFTNNEILAVRQASWSLAENSVEQMQRDVSYLIRALDSKWDDSREFWFGFFQAKFTEKELSPEVLVAVCDSVKPEVQKFGRDLIQTYFKSENGIEYMLKLSEHPAPEMSLFVTNYLENYAANSPEKIAELEMYFVRVLSLVNRSRMAKNRILAFLENEAMKDEKSAQTIAGILARQSATAAIGDKAKTIESMLKIRRKFPEISLPIQVKTMEVRWNL
ncbi:MAG: WGR domain-containing protein [Pyrinomonadaceae bacterium]|nr:WGR domain-containing protein [Pyrinomonadaceae bacterium]